MELLWLCHLAFLASPLSTKENKRLLWLSRKQKTTQYFTRAERLCNLLGKTDNTCNDWTTGSFFFLNFDCSYWFDVEAALFIKLMAQCKLKLIGLPSKKTLILKMIRNLAQLQSWNSGWDIASSAWELWRWKTHKQNSLINFEINGR